MIADDTGYLMGYQWDFNGMVMGCHLANSDNGMVIG